MQANQRGSPRQFWPLWRVPLEKLRTPTKAWSSGKTIECGFFVLQMKAGYGLYEWVAGPYPNDSDVIEGELKSPGEHRVNNKTADVPTTIFLDTFSEKRAAISARIPAQCKAKPDYKPFDTP